MITFNSWWIDNRCLYEKIGISKDVAYKIWSDGYDAAADNCEDILKISGLFNTTKTTTIRKTTYYRN